jgi:hypothetical protein
MATESGPSRTYYSLRRAENMPVNQRRLLVARIHKWEPAIVASDASHTLRCSVHRWRYRASRKRCDAFVVSVFSLGCIRLALVRRLRECRLALPVRFRGGTYHISKAARPPGSLLRFGNILKQPA